MTDPLQSLTTEAIGDIHIDLGVFGELSPFHVRIDKQGVILGIGRTLAMLFGESRPTGRPFRDFFQIVTPRAGDLLGVVEAGSGVVKTVVRTRPPKGHGLPTCKLSGAAFPYSSSKDGTQGVAMILTPGAELQVLLETFPLKRSDLPYVDASPDILFLVETQKQLLQDSLRMSERVEAARREADRLSRSDVLTSLLNRLGLEQQLKRILTTRRTDFTLFHIDLDCFKLLNDTYGHGAGDAVLRHVGDVLKRQIGAEDFAARFGGDEFVLVILGDKTEAAQARAVRILDEIAARVLWNGNVLQVRASIGLISIAPDETLEPEALMHRADLALYEAKNKGRNTWAVFDPEWTAFEDLRREIAAEIPAGLEADAFVPVYQPQINARTGEVIGVEILSRWLHPTRGFLGPGAFAEAASASQTWTRIDNHVRLCALDDISRFEAIDLDIPTYSLNLDMGFLNDRDATRDFIWAASAARVPLEKVTMEIHESVLLDGVKAQLFRPVAELIDHGFRLSLDDFGTGHASLASLIDLPFAELKIDRSFVNGIADSKRLMTLTETMARMGQGLGLSVLAEGVETARDCETLMSFGLDLMQGFYFAKPMLATDLETWLLERKAAHASIARPAS